MTKKTRIRIWIVIAIVCLVGFSDRSFAVDESTGIEVKLGNISVTLNYIVSVLAWLWIFFANIAWEFLTNKRIYGEALWLDVLLRKYWNVIKNFANFWLWVYFVYIILKWLIWTWKNSIEQTLKNNLLWLVIAWIWIQASRFLTAFFIDLSTVTLAAAGSFPSSVVSSSPKTEDALKRMIDSFNYSEDPAKGGWQVLKVKELSLFDKNSKVWEFFKIDNYAQIDTDLTRENFYTGMLEKILPDANNVSGPLYFMWFSMLDITSINTVDQTNIKASIFNIIIKWWTTIIYAIEMLVLCVIALIRILYLWMFIILSPIAILLRCIQQSWQKIWWENKWLNKIIGSIKIETFLINVFKPTIVVLWLWIAVLITSLMGDVIKSSANSNDGIFNIWGVEFSSRMDPGSNTQSDWDATYTTTMNHNLFSFTMSHVWKPLLDLILSILTIIIVYQIIKLAVKMWNWDDFVWKTINSVQEWVWDILWKTPIIPVSGFDEKGQPTTHFLNAGSILKVNSSGELESTLLNRRIDKYQNAVRDRYREQENIVNSWFGNKTRSLTKGDTKTIDDNIKKQNLKGLAVLTEYKNQITTMGNRPVSQWWLNSGEWYGLTLNPKSSDTWWQKKFEKWLQDTDIRNISTSATDAKIWIDMITRWKDPKNQSNRSLETMFKDWGASKERERVKAYAKLFGLNQHLTSWDDLIREDISKK